ncbi:outer membrane protein assembly factor BamE [Solimicrobium silvestre]|nr:outer membrane protein assembly factor BamE [Solimicrobium silvestre]
MLSMFVLISGCASQNPPVQDSSIAASQTTAPATPAAAAPVATSGSSESSDPDHLSTKTVAPVGFEKFMGIFTPYRITIQQGNFVSQEMVAQVKEGMTREQVRFLLGTALLTDMFHADRWDYIFRLLKPSGELITSRVTVTFSKSLVSKIERGELPNEQEYLTRITNAAIVDTIEHTDRKADKPKPKKDE